MTTISMEEYELMKDSKYRMYVAAIDKALKNFDYTSEWADLISALGKLNKVLTSYQKFRVIPRRIKISKRLAQCMHPALPSGVHLKALETYDIIFRTIGTARLSQELFIYSSGLFPLLGHAAMNIRPALLSMYETHFVPLHERLRPALIGFLSGVLPGLESGSDHFERTNQLLENVCDGVGPKYFYTCIWHCVTNNSPVRLPAISYVLSHYKRKLPMEDQLYLMGHDIDLMVSGLCAAVQDTNILVQRSALDLLMVCFPMQNKQLLYADMVRLVTASLTTILRRDMSLNRRLYSWLLEKEGTIPCVHVENEIDDDVNHVHSTIAYDLLNDAIRIILKNSSMEIPLDIKPYRLLTSLFDKPQIGSVILDNILYDVFRALYLSCLQQQKHKALNNGNNNSNSGSSNGSTSTVRCVSFNGDLTSLKNNDDIIVNKQFIMKNCQELIKNANLLFNTLHSFYIWSYIEKIYTESVTNIKNYKTRDRWQVNDIGSGLPNILEICLLTDFLLDIIPIESFAENTSNILPNLFNKIIIIMKLNIQMLNHLEIEKSLELCTKILTKIQPLTTAVPPSSTVTTTTTNQTTTQIIKDDNDVDTTQTMSDDKSVTISLSNINDTNNNNEDHNGLKTSLEKSKSDSKLNENLVKNELTIEDNDSSRERSYSNQMLKKKDKSSPKIDKKTKNKKSKSSSKLYDLKKEETNSTELITENELTTKTTIVTTTLTSSTSTINSNSKKPKTENKFFLKCLEEYKDFYTVFIKCKILPNTNIKKLLSMLIIDKNERTNNLYRMLEESLQMKSDFIPIDYGEILKKTRKLSINSLTSDSSDDDSDDDDNSVNKYESAVNVASNIFLEFSAFPNIITNIDINIGRDKKMKLPKWLQTLLVTACCKESTRNIQIISMNTLLEIFSLSKNQNLLKNDVDENSTNIFINGILENIYVNFIEENTIILEKMSQILWNTIRIATTQKQLLQCVTLLYQIHNIFDNRIIVEEVFGKYLSVENITVEYMKEFFLLWHLGRDLNIKLPPNRTSIRNFDRSLLKILDNLQNPDEPNLQLLAETFLNHSLLHNDIPRIINLILIKLLTPGTARVSIRHININDNDIQSEINFNENRNKIDENQSKKIYAISNENGNIMYHLTNDTNELTKEQQKQQQSSNNVGNNNNNNNSGITGNNTKRKWFTFSKSGKKYSPTIVNVTTSIDDFNNVVTRKNRNDYKNYKMTTTPPINHRIINNNNNNNNNNNKNNVKVIINPLSSKEIYPDGVDGSYSKIDSQQSSTDSLNSTISDNNKTICINNNINNQNNGNDRDSGYESSILKNKLLESIEPISDGLKDDNKQIINNNKIPKSHSFDEKCVNQKINDLENSSLVHSWSYCISDSDNLNAELELSTSAEDFFKKSDTFVIKEILNEMIDNICSTINDNIENDQNTNSHSCIINNNNKRPSDLDLKTKSKNFVLYPIHSHICLYYEIFDSEQILYALQTLKNCLNANPKLFIKCLATSGVKDLKNYDILYLLAKHRKSLLGYSFNGELNHEYINFYRTYMFLDIIILICLNYSRTFFPPYLDDFKIRKYDINNNHKIQLESLELLNLIIKNLIEMVKENTKGFSIYIADMLVKCKLQKIILHCLLTSVRNFDEDDMTFAEQVLLFNNFQLYDRHMKVGEYVEAFQIRILRLVHSLIILEYYVYPQTKSLNNSNQESNNPSTNVDLNYTPTILIPQQNIFLSAVMSALRHENMKNLHSKWLNMITLCLPYFGENIKQITISVIHQICNIIETISLKYNYDEFDDNELCTDYAVTLLESLTILCHYCLLDPSQTVNQTNIPVLNAISQSSTTPTTNPGEIFNNLVSAFFSPDLLSTTSTTTTTSSSATTSSTATQAITTQTITTLLLKQNSEHYQNARKTILSHMPRIISSVAKLWQTIVTLENDNNSIYGNTKIVKQQLLEFLSPISVHHGNSFLAAIAVAWYERRNLFSTIKTVLPEPNAGQNNLVYLISAIRVIPLDNLVQTVIAVIKNPPPIEGLNTDICLDVSVLELFYCYMRNASATQLSEAWSSLLALIREGNSLSPPAQFLLAALLHELMIKCCPLEERKDQKDLQDVTAKLIESVSQVCGSCLEQTTWLRRNLAVKELDEPIINDTNNLIGSNSEIIGNSYSVQAQLVLAEILAPILDICFGSSEKDKVITILTSLMYNIVPYLKTHTTKNMPSFLACSKLLASLSSYQYTRKAWKKDVFDLLLDNSLFQMDYNCLKYWRIIVDNLMTHDNTTFRDLMTRVSLTQSGSLNLFSSREQEYELRAQLLKRLAYVIFCSEMDQYAKYMPDIQEQLTASLRLNVPGVQAQVFLCFRVILIRMSPIQVTSLWPIIISEMLQVFLQIEQELSTDTEEFSSHIKLLSTLDASWSTNSNNGLHALGHPHWLKLQLSTAKLLDLVLLLPAVSLPQFQMYRWAFVGDDLERLDSLEGVPFVPHVVRIAELMDRKFTDTQIETLPMKRNELLLTMNHIDQLKDLHGFFKTLSLCSNKHRTEYCKSSSNIDYITTFGDRQSDKKLNAILEKIDKVVEMDFLDKIPR